MTDVNWKQVSLEVAGKIGELRSCLGQYGLWRTFHLAGKVERGLGWEIAEKLGDKKACDKFEEKVSHP